MKKVGLILVGLVISLASFSQGKYGATPQDSITCIESLIYKDYMKNDPQLALDLWRVAYKTCPQSQKTLYINGVKMFKTLAKKEKDATLQKAYLDTMFSIYAVVCGCKSIIVPEDGVSKKQWQPNIKDRYGLAYGFDDLKEAEKTKELLLESLKIKDANNNSTVKKFVSLCTKYFNIKIKNKGY